MLYFCFFFFVFYFYLFFFFFFQAEDGIRDKLVTGVQTCALPIFDWGYLYLAVPQMKTNKTVAAPAHTSRNSFAEKGTIPAEDDEKMPVEVKDNWPALACTLDLGEVRGEAVSRHIMLCYDDEHSIEHMGKPLKPWWRRWGNHAPQVLTESNNEYRKLMERCEKFDKELMADLKQVGGD